jgi:hypothetical protein
MQEPAAHRMYELIASLQPISAAIEAAGSR